MVKISVDGPVYLLYPNLARQTIVDEVFDDGDSIVVRSRGEEDRIPFSNIDDVVVGNNSIDPLIYLKLISSGKFGSRIAFRPQVEGPARWNLDSFWMDPIVNDLLARAQKAGAGRAAFRSFVKTDYVLQVVYASILAAGGLVALVVAIFTINDFAVALALILLPGAYIVWLVAKGMRGASRES